MSTDASGLWPSYRYAWRMSRFRPKRQLINLFGVFVGWLANLLPGLGAKIVFDRLAEGRVAGSLGWLVWPLVLVLARGLVALVTVPTLQLTNGAFAYANAAMLQRNMLRRILELPGGRSLPSSPGEAISRFRDDTEAGDRSLLAADPSSRFAALLRADLDVVSR